MPHLLGEDNLAVVDAACKGRVLVALQRKVPLQEVAGRGVRPDLRARADRAAGSWWSTQGAARRSAVLVLLGAGTLTCGTGSRSSVLYSFCSLRKERPDTGASQPAPPRAAWPRNASAKRVLLLQSTLAPHLDKQALLAMFAGAPPSRTRSSARRGLLLRCKFSTPEIILRDACRA